MANTLRVGVIGGGVQGALIALELAERGVAVDLYERSERPLQKASRWNEGKIHLGYIYAKDRVERTATLMIEGATRYGPLLSRFVGEQRLRESVSEPFTYKVLEGTQVEPDELHRRYSRMADLANDALAQSGRDYLGATGPVSVERVKGVDDGLEVKARALFRTCERSVNPRVIADALWEALQAAPRVRLHTNAVIEGTTRDASGRLCVSMAGEVVGRYDHVVNATWDQRLALDQTMNHVERRPHLHRNKVAVQIPHAPSRVPTVTMVHGPFGDTVQYGDGSVYLSWYPVGCFRKTTDLAPPVDWHDEPDGQAVGALTAGIMEELAARVPAVKQLDLSQIEHRTIGGVIFTWGDTDIDDVDSELHKRFDVGPKTIDGDYHTVDTGKFTLAPLFAHQLATQIAA